MPILIEGFSARFTFSENEDIAFYERTIKPFGLDGGGPINTTTMRNTALRTQEPKQLIGFTPGSATVVYDPALLADILALINVKQQISITWPDDSTYTFWGWLSKFEFGDLKEGEQPEATIELFCAATNADLEETAPTYDEDGDSGGS